MLRTKFFFIVFTVLFLSCVKDNNENTSDKIVFEGITSTDYNGAIISVDVTDWCFQDDWSVLETSLFTDEKELTCNLDDFNYQIISYPNPCNGTFYLNLLKPEDSMLAIRVVDKNFNVLVSLDSIYVSSLAFDLTSLNFSNEIVRVYYKVFGEDCELRGHGDIKIN